MAPPPLHPHMTRSRFTGILPACPFLFILAPQGLDAYYIGEGSEEDPRVIEAACFEPGDGVLNSSAKGDAGTIFYRIDNDIDFGNNGLTVGFDAGQSEDRRATANLGITPGAAIRSANGTLGHSVNDKGDVRMGAGSSWTVSNQLTYGASGRGVTQLVNASVSATTIQFGENETGFGIAMVAGPEAKLESTGDLVVGNSGLGEILVDFGAHVVTGQDAVLGSLGDSLGVVMLQDEGTLWSIGRNLILGEGTGSIMCGFGALMTVDGDITMGADDFVYLIHGYLAIKGEHELDELMEDLNFVLPGGEDLRPATAAEMSVAYYATYEAGDPFGLHEIYGDIDLTGYTIITAVPEPSTYALLGALGALCLAICRRGKQRQPV